MAAFVALASAVLALSTRSSDVPRTGASQLRRQSSVSDGLGTEATTGRTTAPSANGARPEPAVAAAPEPETSTAATLAALGITVATTPPPDELTRIDELTTGGELARLRELAAAGHRGSGHRAPDAPRRTAPDRTGPRRTVADALAPDALATDALAPDALAPDALLPTPWPRSTCSRGTGPRRTGHRARGGSRCPRRSQESRQCRHGPGGPGGRRPR